MAGHSDCAHSGNGHSGSVHGDSVTESRYRQSNERADREGLLGGASSAGATGKTRGRLLDANERASKQNDVIRGALEIA